MRAELARKIAARTVTRKEYGNGYPGLRLYRRSAPTACTSSAYEPSLVVFLQGQKRINVGKHDLCVRWLQLPACLGRSARRQPGHCGNCKRSRFSAYSQTRNAGSPRDSLPAGISPPRRIRRRPRHGRRRHIPRTAQMHVPASSICLTRPQDIPFLGSLIQREIIYRLLRSPQGKHLRAIATLGEQSHRTAKAVEWLRVNYAKPLRVEELATMARMGVSTLHHQFRSLTAMSPLQYQKQLRLQVARERMLNRRTRCRKRRLRSRLRKRQPVQSRVQPFLR